MRPKTRLIVVSFLCLDRYRPLVGLVLSTRLVSRICLCAASASSTMHDHLGGGKVGEKAHQGRSGIHSLQGSVGPRPLGKSLPVMGF
jgi:hypothetical protein